MAEDRQHRQVRPSFEALFGKDAYQDPQLKSLVTHKWGEEDNSYRTGVFVKKNKRVRFFNGNNEKGNPCHMDLDYDYTPERFHQHLCLARLDLDEGR